MKPWRLITNGLLFQVAWCCVFFFHQVASLVLPAILSVMVLLSGTPRNALISLLNLPLALGIEWCAVSFSLVDYHAEIFPAWLVWLWCCLLTTLSSSLAFLYRFSHFHVLLLCLLAVPVSYLAGENAGVLSISRPLWIFWPSFGLLWGVGFISILMINQGLQHVLGSKRPVL